MIKHVNILTLDGKSLLFREYGATKVDQDLLAGFMSAFSGFMKEISRSEIKSTVTGNSKFIYSFTDQIMIVICTDIKDNEEEIYPILETIFSQFLEKYSDLFKNNKWDGERTIFKEFKENVDKIVLGPIKVSILGYGGVGKTTLTKLIIGEEINLEYVPTITADIATFDKMGKRSIVLWDFAGQIQFTDLWDSLLKETRIVLLVTDSSYKNVQDTKKIMEKFIEKDSNMLIIGIANKQDLQNKLSTKFVEKILNVPTFGMIAINPNYRIMIHEILNEFIEKINKIDGFID
ncbi:GTP-binding protein [Promethearchaeum syntrophicum]|uniref:GTP-binding protein n=1 Tax=Promethearchaeum syntrophicum TaxID=2594042 RepID=A0A5B9DE31_9ARCH|nr:GTP-binding protein [Candidatus Prometheoarchaeum syntrophicum]QEE17251.1 GTPase Der [Candidatus Prometheoarchaeum syntrophicum]